jgi:hypothetical protein
MQGTPHGPRPQRHPLNRDDQPKPTTSRNREEAAPADSGGTRLLRLAWVLVGAAFAVLVLLIGATVLMLHYRAQHPVVSTEEAVAKNEEVASRNAAVSSTKEKDAESELLGIDNNSASPHPPSRADEVDRVLGHTLKPPPGDDPLPPPEPPPPAPAPKREEKKNTPATPPPPLKPASDTPPPSAKSTASDAEAAFQKRLQASEDDLRGQLAAVPELRLFSDLEVQGFRQIESQDERKANSRSRTEIEYAFNLRLNQSLRKAAVLSGLPVMSGPNCRLDPTAATIVQTLSKDLRDMGFVSVPGAAVRVRFSSGRVANVAGTTIGNGSPKEKIDAFKEWCDQNRVEKFRGALATLLQMLQVEDAEMRLLLVRELAKMKSAGATAALAKRALVDLSPEVRKAAVAALQKRFANQYVPVLLQGLRYPWPPVADHAADALLTLKPEGVTPKLVDLLDQPDPSTPVLDKRTNKPVVRELVRLNHLRNCLLCHAPSANQNDGLVRGLVPTPGQPLPRLYYASQTGNFVRADITFLRQDFSVNLTVPEANPWPKEQRYDFITRIRPVKPEEMPEITRTANNYPQRDAVLHTLRGLTGKDAGDLSTKWRDALGITTKTEKDVTDLTSGVKKGKPGADKSAVPEKDVSRKP